MLQINNYNNERNKQKIHGTFSRFVWECVDVEAWHICLSYPRDLLVILFAEWHEARTCSFVAWTLSIRQAQEKSTRRRMCFASLAKFAISLVPLCSFPNVSTWLFNSMTSRWVNIAGKQTIWKKKTSWIYWWTDNSVSPSIIASTAYSHSMPLRSSFHVERGENKILSFLCLW